MSQPQARRRHVVVPATEAKRGRIWGFGVRTLASLSGKSVHAVRDAIGRGDLDPKDLRSVLAWVVKNMPTEVPGKGWQPAPPNLSDAVIAAMIGNSASLVRRARLRGQFDPKDGLSTAAWIYERRRWPKPVPSRSFERFAFIALPPRMSGGQREPPGVATARPNSRRKRALAAVVRDLQELGFKGAEIRGEAHVYLKPDFLPFVAARRLVQAMREQRLDAASLPLRRRRQLALGPSVDTSSWVRSRVSAADRV